MKYFFSSRGVLQANEWTEMNISLLRDINYTKLKVHGTVWDKKNAKSNAYKSDTSDRPSRLFDIFQKLIIKCSNCFNLEKHL